MKDGPKFDSRLGERLRLMREAAGMTTRDLAVALLRHGVHTSHVTVGNYERSRTLPPSEYLAAVANICGRTEDALLEGAPVLAGVRYRCLKSVKERDKDIFEGQSQGLFEGYLRLERLLNDPLKNIRGDLRVDRNWNGEKLADAVRSKYKLGIYPLPSAVTMVQEFGIRVIELRSDARIDAFAGWFGDARVVAVNSRLPNDRVRLTVLHELAHHLYEDCVEGVALPSDEIETRAFEFASHVLIPSDQLRKAFSFQSMVKLVQYKERFGVSLAAMLYRAGKERIISQSMYQRIWREFGRLGLNRQEPGHVTKDRPIRFEAMLDTAIGRGLATIETVAAWCGCSPADLESRRLEAMGGSNTTSASKLDDEEQGSDSQSLRITDYM